MAVIKWVSIGQGETRFCLGLSYKGQILYLTQIYGDFKPFEGSLLTKHFDGMSLVAFLAAQIFEGMTTNRPRDDLRWKVCCLLG